MDVNKGGDIQLQPAVAVIMPRHIKKLFLPGEVGAILDWQVKDPTGKVTAQGIRKSESFVEQFLELLWVQGCQIIRSTPYSVRDTSNVVQNICEGYHTFACDAAIGSILSGIVVGTDNTAPTISDYHLVTIILHDAAPPTAGRLQYGAVTFGAPSSDATTSQFTITRNFANASGGAITVNEIGLFVKGNIYSTDYYFMTIRDVIGGGILVPNGQTLTVNYRPTAVV